MLRIKAIQYLALQGMFLLITYCAWFAAILSVLITPKKAENLEKATWQEEDLT